MLWCHLVSKTQNTFTTLGGVSGLTASKQTRSQWWQDNSGTLSSAWDERKWWLILLFIFCCRRSEQVARANSDWSELTGCCHVAQLRCPRQKSLRRLPGDKRNFLPGRKPATWQVSDGSTSKTAKPVARRCHSKIAYMWLHLYRQIQHTLISAWNGRAWVAKLFLLHLTWAFNSAPCIPTLC